MMNNQSGPAMTIKNIHFRATVGSAFYALMPYILANAYMTLVLNWPGMETEIHKLDLQKMQLIPQLNFAFCIYAIATILFLLLERFIGVIIVHGVIICGFFLGIGILYAVLVPLQVLVNPYISAVILINSVISILSMFLFYYELIDRWFEIRKHGYTRIGRRPGDRVTPKPNSADEATK